MILFSKPERTIRPAAACVAAAIVLTCAVGPAWSAETCDREQIAAAIDSAGEKLRQLTTTTQPVLQAKLQRLKQVKGWSDQEYEDKGYAALEDERTAKLDSQANRLLARLDTLSKADPIAGTDCSTLNEIEAVSLELQATVRTKGQYVLGRLDQMMGEAAAPTATAQPKAPEKTATSPPPPAAPASPVAKAPPAAPKQDRWSTATTATPSAPIVAVPLPLPAPPSAPAEAEGYTIDEIVNASSGLFGKVSANLARVLEHAFANSGRPTGYILGEETGGAFIAGLRYGKGKLYLRSGATMPVYWHGPSLGADVGAQGTATLFLIYKVQQPEDVFANFTGIEGSAFVVGGLGMTVMTNGKINMTPIRSGLGLRIGASLGYVRFTSQPTWNPF